LIALWLIGPVVDHPDSLRVCLVDTSGGTVFPANVLLPPQKVALISHLGLEMIDDSLSTLRLRQRGCSCIGPGTGALRCARTQLLEVCCCFPKSLHDFEIWKRLLPTRCLLLFCIQVFFDNDPSSASSLLTPQDSSIHPELEDFRTNPTIAITTKTTTPTNDTTRRHSNPLTV